MPQRGVYQMADSVPDILQLLFLSLSTNLSGILNTISVIKPYINKEKI